MVKSSNNVKSYYFSKNNNTHKNIHNHNNYTQNRLYKFKLVNNSLIPNKKNTKCIRKYNSNTMRGGAQLNPIPINKDISLYDMLNTLIPKQTDKNPPQLQPSSLFYMPIMLSNNSSYNDINAILSDNCNNIILYAFIILYCVIKFKFKIHIISKNLTIIRDTVLPILLRELYPSLTINISTLKNINMEDDLQKYFNKELTIPTPRCILKHQLQKTNIIDTNTNTNTNISKIEIKISALLFDEFLYKLSDENVSLYDLKQYEIGAQYNSLLKIDIDTINTYISKEQPCSTNFITYLKYLYSKTVFFDAVTITNQLNKNIEDLHENYNNKIHILCISKDSLQHTRSSTRCAFNSGLFYVLYFINKYKIKFGKYPLIYSFEYTTLEDRRKYINDPNTLFIFSDDIIYTGSQLVSFIESTKIIESQGVNNLYNSTTSTHNILIYLNIYGYTDKAYNKLTNIELNQRNTYDPTSYTIVWPNGVLPLTNSLRKLTQDFIESNSSNVVKTKHSTMLEKTIEFILQYNIIFYNDGTSPTYYNVLSNILKYFGTYLIYTFYKFPDNTSTYPLLCYINVYNKNTKFMMLNLVDRRCIKNAYIDNLTSLYKAEKDDTPIDIDILEKTMTGILNIILTHIRTKNLDSSVTKATCADIEQELSSGPHLLIKNTHATPHHVQDVIDKFKTDHAEKPNYDIINTKTDTSLNTICTALNEPFYTLIKYTYNNKPINQSDDKSLLTIYKIYESIKFA